MLQSLAIGGKYLFILRDDFSPLTASPIEQLLDMWILSLKISAMAMVAGELWELKSTDLGAAQLQVKPEETDQSLV